MSKVKLPVKCKNCSKIFDGFFPSFKRRFCGRKCQGEYYQLHPSNTGKTRFKKGQHPWNKGKTGLQAREKHPNWSGGTTKRKDGYVLVNTKDGRRLLEHRLVVENYLGESLPKQIIVHHKDKDRSNNQISNLEIMTNSEHTTIHNLERWAK